MSVASAPQSPDRYTPKWVWAVIALAAVLPRIKDFLMPINRDSGLFAYGGWRILHGELPYTGFWDNKLPGVFYIDALAIWTFGPSPGGLVVFQMIYGAATLALFYLVARRLSTLWPALICTLLFAVYSTSYALSEGGNYTETYTSLPVLAAVLMLLRWERTRSGLLAPLVAGALAAVAIIIKQPAGAVLGAMLLYLIVGLRSRQSMLAAVAMAGGAAAVALLLVGWMAATGILSEAINANVVFNRLYLRDSYSYGLNAGRINLVSSLGYMALPIAGAVAGIVTLIRRREENAAGHALLLVSWLVLDLIGVAMGGRFTGHYFITMLPSSLLLTAVFLDRSARGRVAFVATAVAGLVLLVGPVWSVGTVRPDGSGIRLESIARRELHILDLAFNSRLGGGSRLPAERAAAWVRQRTEPNDEIYVWGWETRAAFLARRRMSSRYLHTHPLGATGFDRDARIAELAQDLETRRPVFILDTSALLPTTAPPLAGDAPLSTAPFFRLDGYEPIKRVVARNYEPGGEIDRIVIYALRDAD